MTLPSFSYRGGRGSLTGVPTSTMETGFNYSSEVPVPLFATEDHTSTEAPGAARTQPAAGAAPLTNVDAARHNVLRRLAPALKHDMVVNLQAVSMMAEMLNARMERGGMDPADLQASIAKLNRLAREAVMTCLQASSWIEPGEDDTIALHDGVAECVALVAGSFNFRGFSIANEVQPTEFEVCRGALRNLLAASLITLSDTTPAPCELQLTAEISAGCAVLTVSAHPESGDTPRGALDAPAPRIEWGDVQALAAAESVELFRTNAQIVMRLPRALPSSPLRMVPM